MVQPSEAVLGCLLFLLFILLIVLIMAFRAMGGEPEHHEYYKELPSIACSLDGSLIKAYNHQGD